MKRKLLIFFLIAGALVFGLWGFSLRKAPEKISYGVSFSSIYTEELGLNWREVYRAILDDLGARKVRIAAYWSMIEPERNSYFWDDLDFQVEEAGKRDASVILAVGRRLPRWPECHVPDWTKDLDWESQKKEIMEQVRAVVERYKGKPAVAIWQVENEPYIPVFAAEQCGSLDRKFFEEEIALVRSLDSRPVMITDGGNFGLWFEAYRKADIFGTSVYLYLWNEKAGQFRTILPPAYYRIKTNLMRLFGVKPVILSELSLEPWLGSSLASLAPEEQLRYIDIGKFNEIINFARETRFSDQYLWGAGWWYLMKEKGHPEFWNAARELLREN